MENLHKKFWKKRKSVEKTIKMSYNIFICYKKNNWRLFMNKLVKRIVALFLVITLMSANLLILGEYTIAYALSDEELNKQDSETNQRNVEFNSYFYGGTHNATFDIDSESAILYIRISVENAGYLENGTIEFQNNNFKIKEEISNENIQSINTETNIIVLNKINNGSDITIELPIEILEGDYVSLDYFNKETTTKFTGTYVDGNGNEKSVEKEVINKLAWSGTAEVELTAEATKFVPYATGESYGVLVQTKINSSIADSALPIKTTNIEVNAPTIDGTLPSYVKVISTKLEATNGETDGLNFTTENYSYDAEEGIVTISTANLADSISWKKNVTDEYYVTYIFDGLEIYEYANENEIEVAVTVNANIEVYNSTNVTVTESTEVEASFTESEGAITDFNMNLTNKIGKGYIYANYDREDKIETEYKTTYTANIYNSEIIDYISFTQGYDAFVNEDDQEYTTTVGMVSGIAEIDGETISAGASEVNLAYNKRVEISQEIFNKILGEDGTITITDFFGKELGVINKDSTLEEGKYILDISENDRNQITIETSAPITEGQLEITITKALNGNDSYTLAQMQTFEKMRAYLKGNTNTTTFTVTKEMSLEEPETVVNLELSKTDLTTVLTNENVEIRAVLDTSSVYNALFENPTLKITLPAEIESVNLKSTNIVLANGLIIESSEVVEENGRQVINIVLSGTQTDYTIDAEYKGAIITLNVDLTLEMLTPSGTGEITLDYTNENEVTTNAEGTVKESVNFVAPSGVVAASGISNYKDGASDILTISDEAETVEIDTYSDSRTVKISASVINNYDNNISNVVILGRIPAEGNTNIDSETELGSTFTMPLSSAIALSGIDEEGYTIYYSDSENATSDLEDSSNSWSETATTASRSYLIVLDDDYEMESGEKIDFEYEVELPEQLSNNNNSYAVYKVYYDNDSEIGTMEENKLSATIGLSTGTGPELEVSIAPTVDVIREGQIVKIKATITNVGEVDATNVELSSTAPEFLTFVDYAPGSGFYDDEEETKSISIGTIGAGETVEISYYIQIDDYVQIEEDYNETDDTPYVETYPVDIVYQVTVTADDLEEGITADYTFSVEDGKIAFYIYNDVGENDIIQNGMTVTYSIQMINIAYNGESLNNVVLTLQLPQGTTFVSGVVRDSWTSTDSISDGFIYEDTTNTLIINVGTLELQKYVEFQLTIDDYQEDLSIIATATADDTETHYSNAIDNETGTPELEISELTTSPRYVPEGEEVTYELTITNIGDTDARNLVITDTLPSELTFVEATYTYSTGETVTVSNLTDGVLQIQLTRLTAGASIVVTVTAQAGLLPSTDDVTIENKMTVSANNFEAVETNTVTNIIEYNSSLHNGGSENPNNRYKISGTAWIDTNMDGKRDSSEQTIPDMEVMLLSEDGTTVIADADTGEEKITTTSSSGTYEFDNLPNGNYLVVFLYDSSTYTLTDYQKSGVDESFNSDAIEINITIDGERRIAAITDVITVNGANVRDIDIGLYTSERFDLSLDKYVSKITVTTNTSGTTEYDFGEQQVAMVQVRERNVGYSSAVIEYKIVVTNEGTVSGYANKIVDYLPDGVTFNSELNTDWYLSDNGNIYNASLANDRIEPGETREISLIVNVNITEDLIFSTLTNTAEIYESYNELALQDIDSSAGNQVSGEDDMSVAEVVLAITTGNEIIIYTGIALVVIAIIGFGAYEIKKRVLNKKV